MKREKGRKTRRIRKQCYHYCGGRCRAKSGNPFDIFRQRVMLFCFVLFFFTKIYESGSEGLGCCLCLLAVSQMIPLHFSISQFQRVNADKAKKQHQTLDVPAVTLQTFL